MTGSMIGATYQVTHRITESDLVTSLFPGEAVFAGKPDVMATAMLGALCEWPAMEALRLRIGRHEDSLGTELHITHQRGREGAARRPGRDAGAGGPVTPGAADRDRRRSAVTPPVGLVIH
ncbi:MAG: hypothetical protein ACRD0P_10980 [Stackebrandtia sp.]